MSMRKMGFLGYATRANPFRRLIRPHQKPQIWRDGKPMKNVDKFKNYVIK